MTMSAPKVPRSCLESLPRTKSVRSSSCEMFLSNHFANLPALIALSPSDVQ